MNPNHKAFLIDCSLCMIFNLIILGLLTWLVIAHNWSEWTYVAILGFHYTPSKELLK